MGLLQPESGLLFWMTLSFAVVFVVLAKFGFPVILRAIDSRKEYVESSLEAAKKAEQKIQSLEADSKRIISEAETRRSEILHNAESEQTRIMAEAKQKAIAESNKIIENAHRQAEAERQAILEEAKSQVAALAIAITERLLRHNVTDKTSQMALAEQLLSEIKRPKDETPCT